MTTPAPDANFYGQQIESALRPYGISLEDPAQQNLPQVPESTAPERAIVKPAANSRLEGLLCEYEQRKSEAAEAESKFKELKAAIVAELEGLYPDESTRPTVAYEIPSSLMYPALVMQYKVQWYLPADSVKTHLPEFYEAFKKEKSYPELRESQKGKGMGGRRK